MQFMRALSRSISNKVSHIYPIDIPHLKDMEYLWEVYRRYMGQVIGIDPYRAFFELLFWKRQDLFYIVIPFIVEIGRNKLIVGKCIDLVVDIVDDQYGIIPEGIA